MAGRIHRQQLIHLADSSRCLSSTHPHPRPHPHRCFSATPIPQLTQRRRAMIKWLKGPGAQFRRPRQGTTNYLGAYDRSWKWTRGEQGSAANEEGNEEEGEASQEAAAEKEKGDIPPERPRELMPFPLNAAFRSESVLSVQLRDEIYRRVVQENQTLREVSIDLNVSMQRVAAVARLKTIEQEWKREGKPTNSTYEKTVMDMLPQTAWAKGATDNPRHESINDLPVHAHTLPQLFHPTSESRHFTREDASRVFHRNLLPADARIPHPEMIELAKDAAAGYKRHELNRRLQERIEEMETKRKDAKQRALEREARQTTVVEGRRWDFRFKDVSVEGAGKDGRGRTGVGWRYGAPHEDRKRGQVKIPTKVD